MATKRSSKDYLELLFIAVFSALVIRTFVLSGYKVPSDSMSPALLQGEHIFAYRLPYGVVIPFTDFKWGHGLPQRGDVVVFKDPQSTKSFYVRRVVGLPGDLIQMKNGQLRINDQPLQYQSLGDGHWEEVWPENRRVLLGAESKDLNLEPFVVPPDEVYLLPDQRVLKDQWSAVPLKALEGRVEWIWMSWDWKPSLPKVRWHRVFKSVH